MKARPMSTDFAQLLRDLATREGADLERALADSGAIFARLGAHALPMRPPQTALGDGVLSLRQAERELAQLILRELKRLCEQSAALLDDAPDRAEACRDLSELLLEELDCARTMDCLAPWRLEQLGELAHGLARADCATGEFRRFADELRLSAAADLTF